MIELAVAEVTVLPAVASATVTLLLKVSTPEMPLGAAETFVASVVTPTRV